MQPDCRDIKPVYEQITDGIRKMIITHAIPEGEKLPSVYHKSSPSNLTSLKYILKDFLICYTSFKNAPRFPRFPWLALWENSRFGLQQVQRFVTARCSGRIPASRSTISLLFHRSS